MTGVLNNISNVGNGTPHASIKTDSDDDIPLTDKLKRSRAHLSSSDEDDDIPLATKLMRISKKPKLESPDRFRNSETRSHGDHKKTKDVKIEKPKIKKEQETPTKSSDTPNKNNKSDKPEEEVWRWWEEEKKDNGVKWTFLEHKGPIFAPPYERLPDNVRFYYDGQPVRLSDAAEEVAGFYARMLDHDYTTKEVFNKNFFKDWLKVMNDDERRIIKSLSKCDFREMHAHFLKLTEERKNRTKEEKQKLKEENLALLNEYGYCTLDGHRQRIGNFRIEPPGLFRGRGNHPKMGMLKKRVLPEHVIINCSKNSKIPVPPKGHRWKEVRHDNTVTWLACWTENVQNNFKYVMLNPSSRLKGEKDWKKYETARGLHKIIDRIRADYRADFKHKEMRIRQRAVALYFIDRLALRAGNEKDEDEADTVGCCSLRYEHIKLHEELDGKQYVVEFDFLGKDSIRYQNSVAVPKRVFKNVRLFLQNKKENDDLFDRLNTTVLNQYLRELMEGLTAKVFRTYNASRTLEEQLELLTDPNDSPQEKLLAYNRANRAVAVLCNHQRAVPKSFAKSMENLQKKIDAKRDQIAEITNEAKQIKADYKRNKQVAKKVAYEKLKKRLSVAKEQLAKLQLQATDRDENKEIALSTSKLNYLDPRITVAWCKRFNVPIEKVYNKTQREKFQWAIDMATAEYKFLDRDSDRNTNKLKAEESDEGEMNEDED
ncbi:DNA topoisomerase 1 [Clonorchis sinensis]|uniref:DNA topoisomerase 1 n=2 Tax=Clonorchis sinensis TaxID=79923 RepID=A0A8T1M3Q7_CLOSI|nr:DNA topoisomerase 1 [Clonorchis sinensis]GAA28973.2 DNA topoisomerase I [Clonorchis sinensis]